MIKNKRKVHLAIVIPHPALHTPTPAALLGHGPYGEQVAANTISLEEVEAKCEKGVKMSLQLQIEEMPDYLAARFTGAGVAEEAWRRFELIAERCKRANKNKLLLDFTEARGEISIADRYFLGDAAQLFLDYKLTKVAAVDRPERVDPQRFVEKVIRNRWVNARVFTNVEDAEKWLLK